MLQMGELAVELSTSSLAKPSKSRVIFLFHSISPHRGGLCTMYILTITGTGISSALLF